MAEQGVSLAPEAFVKGGGLVDDIDAVIKESRFATWDYQGHIAQPVLALKLTLTDDDGTDYEQYYSAGDLKHFAPSNDGKSAVPTGSKAGLTDGSNFYLFIQSLINAGYDAANLAAGDISVLEGVRAHFNRVPQPKRSGLPSTSGQGQREQTVLVVSKLLKATPPKKTGVASKATASKAAPAPSANGEAIDEQLVDLVMAILAENDGTIAKSKLGGAVFKAATGVDAKTKAAMSKRAFADDFLADEGRPWSFDGSTLSM